MQTAQTDLKMPAFKIKVIVMRPQAKEHWQSPELGEVGSRFSPEPLGAQCCRHLALNHPLLGCTEPPGMGANSLLFQPPSLSHGITC